MKRPTRFVPVLCTSMLLASCASAGSGPRVTAIASGLVGEWIGPTKPGSTDTTLWRFSADGKSVQVRIKPGHKPEGLPYGPFQVYGDTGHTQVICFSFRRSRAERACRYFQIDTLSTAPGASRRQLRLLNWIDEKRGASEVWIENAQ